MAVRGPSVSFPPFVETERERGGEREGEVKIKNRERKKQTRLSSFYGTFCKNQPRPFFFLLFFLSSVKWSPPALPCVVRTRRRGFGEGERKRAFLPPHCRCSSGVCRRCLFFISFISFFYSFLHFFLFSNDPAQQLEGPLASPLGKQRPQPPGEVRRVGHEQGRARRRGSGGGGCRGARGAGSRAPSPARAPRR